MRIISLVVEGLEQARDAGLYTWLLAQDADIICLQDTRCSEYSLKGNDFFPSEYNAYFWDDVDDHQRHYNRAWLFRLRLQRALYSSRLWQFEYWITADAKCVAR